MWMDHEWIIIVVVVEEEDSKVYLSTQAQRCEWYHECFLDQENVKLSASVYYFYGFLFVWTPSKTNVWNLLVHFTLSLLFVRFISFDGLVGSILHFAPQSDETRDTTSFFYRSCWREIWCDFEQCCVRWKTVIRTHIIFITTATTWRQKARTLLSPFFTFPANSRQCTIQSPVVAFMTTVCYYLW